jgi:hypothetical protein
MLCRYADYRQAECQNSFIVMLNVIVLNVIMLASQFFYCYAECRYAECCPAECSDSFTVMLSVVMLNVIMLSVAILLLLFRGLLC